MPGVRATRSAHPGGRRLGDLAGFYPVPVSSDQRPFERYQPPSEPSAAEPAPVEAFRCPNCGSTQFNPGFIDDTANGIVRWILGPIEFGLLGGLKRSGRQNRVIVSYRCTGCSRLELYAGEQT